jgi:hypothetical protein
MRSRRRGGRQDSHDKGLIIHAPGWPLRDVEVNYDSSARASKQVVAT